MRIRVAFREDPGFKIRFVQQEQHFHPHFGEINVDREHDYNKLINRPKINGVDLIGNKTTQELGLGQVYYDTTYAWNTQTYLIAERATIYVYSDYKVIYDDVGNPTYVAGIKVGDGTSYLIDMPFVTDEMTTALLRHIANNQVHLTDAEREFWNNKISCFLDSENEENLILSKTDYILEGG